MSGGIIVMVIECGAHIRLKSNVCMEWLMMMENGNDELLG